MVLIGPNMGELSPPKYLKALSQNTLPSLSHF